MSNKIKQLNENSFFYDGATYGIQFINSDGKSNINFEINIYKNYNMETKPIKIDMFNNNNHKGLECFDKNLKDFILDMISMIICKKDNEYIEEVIMKNNKEEIENEDIEIYKPTDDWGKSIMNMF